MSDEDMIRMEDLNAEMIGLNPNGRELTSVEEELLDKYASEEDFAKIVQTLDDVVIRIANDTTDQEALYAYTQWAVNMMWRYIDLHDHMRRGECAMPTMKPMVMEPQTLNFSECGTPECGPKTEEE